MIREEIRSFFPHLDKGIIYFNHASTGPMSTPVISRINELLKERSESQPDEFNSFLKVANETKELLARYLNTNKNRIAFIDNTSNGINLLAQSLSLQKGDKILLNEIEFPANVYPFLHLQKKGITIEIIKSRDGIVTAEEVISSVDERTKLISISFVQFLSGYRLDILKLGEFCRKENIILSVDAIQGLGAFQLDVEKCNIDFLSCGTQKWLLGLQGMAFIFLSESLQQKLDPVFAGWLSIEDAWDLLSYELKFKTTAEAFQTGTVNTIGVYALNTVLKVLESYGYKRIENNVIDNTLFLRNKLTETGMKLYPAELEEKYFSGIVSFYHPDPEGLFNWLTGRNIFVSLREGLIRLSPHFYNTEVDIDKVVDVVSNY